MKMMENFKAAQIGSDLTENANPSFLGLNDVCAGWHVLSFAAADDKPLESPFRGGYYDSERAVRSALGVMSGQLQHNRVVSEGSREYERKERCEGRRQRWR
jgi:hypothetical protein